VRTWDVKRFGIASMAACGMAACARAPTSAASPLEPAVATGGGVANTCALSGGSRGPKAAPRVFLELACAQGDPAALLAPHPAPHGSAPNSWLEGFLADPRLERISVLHVLAPNDTSRTLAWDLERHDGSVEPWSVTLTPHVNGPSPAGVRVEVTLTPTKAGEGGATREASEQGAAGRANTTVVVHDQQSVVLAGFAPPTSTATQTMVVLTPYVLWDEADLASLLECKRQRAHAARP
jgi:hypothetical protein